jgi:hypothetical protein
MDTHTIAEMAEIIATTTIYSIPLLTYDEAKVEEEEEGGRRRR